jgi:hypothetical protein
VAATTLVEFILGLAIGCVSGIFGITGGVIAVPLLGILGFGEHVAQGTSLVMQLPTGIVGLWQYKKRSNLSARLIATLAAASAPATYLGAQVALHLPGPSLRRAFAIFIALLATLTIWNAFRNRSLILELPRRLVPIVAAAGGLCSGLFGVGGATFTIPVFTLLFGFSQAEAQGMALAVVLPAIVVSIPVYTLAGFADWRLGLVLGLGSLSTVGFAVALAHKLPERVLRIGLSLVLYGGASALWIHG